MLDPGDFQCPVCHEAFKESDVEVLLSDPFNGVGVLCETCKVEYNVNLRFVIEKC